MTVDPKQVAHLLQALQGDAGPGYAVPDRAGVKAERLVCGCHIGRSPSGGVCELSLCRTHGRAEAQGELGELSPFDLDGIAAAVLARQPSVEYHADGEVPLAMLELVKDAYTVELVGVRDAATGERLRVIAGDPTTVVDDRRSRVEFTATFRGTLKT